MSVRAWSFVVIASLFVLVAGVAAQDSGAAHASVEVGATSGGRSEADVRPVLATLRRSLARCGRDAESAHGAEVRVSLDVAASGRATATEIPDAGAPVPDPAAAFRACVARALARTRLAAGESGTVQLRVGWVEARGYGTATLGGFHSRGSSLPGGMRAEAARPPYPQAQVTAVAQEHATEVRHCFDSALAHRPDVSGSVHVEITIGVDGAVTHTEVESDGVHTPAITACLLARVATWTFPAPSDGQPATVTHIFALR